MELTEEAVIQGVKWRETDSLHEVFIPKSALSVSIYQSLCIYEN